MDNDEQWVVFVSSLKKRSFRIIRRVAGNQFYWNATGGSRSGVLYAGGTAGLAEIRLLPRAPKICVFFRWYIRACIVWQSKADDKKLVR